MSKWVKIVLGSLTLLLGGIGCYLWYLYNYEPADIIKYSEENQISFSDFKGRPDTDVGVLSWAQFRIFFRYQCKDKLTFTIYAFMYPETSWMIDKSNETTLISKRVEFKCYELYARKLRKSLLELENPCHLSNSELQEIGDKNYVELGGLLDKIDEDIQNGDKPERVNFWNTKLDSLLQTYQTFTMERLE